MAVLITVDQWSPPPLKQEIREHVERVGRRLIAEGDAFMVEEGYDPARVTGALAAERVFGEDRVSVRYRRFLGDAPIKVVVNYFVPTETFFVPVAVVERPRLDEGWDDTNGG